ncbi:MAG: transcriptional regulator [Aeromicrobium sp.]|nr:transcriptional regulator [Aeromicrobium sp.]
MMASECSSAVICNNQFEFRTPKETVPGMETRTDRRKQVVRERILDAAFNLFLSQGVGATKIEDICKLADVANRTFFNHFATRQDMMRALGERRLLNLHEVAGELPGDSAPAHLRELFEAVAVRLDETGEAYRELIGAMLGTHGYGVQRGTDLHDAFLEIIKEGVSSGQFATTHDPNVLADVVTSGFVGAIVNWTVNPTYSLSTGMTATAEALVTMLQADETRPTPG